MKYYYIHGLNATGKTTAKKLGTILETDVPVFSWNYLKTFDENFNNILTILEENQEDYILMGSSMGGYYANALANKLQVPCALFNPVINPQEVFQKYCNETNLSKEVINSYKPVKNNIIPRLIVVGTKDEVLNPNKTIEYWKGKCNLKIVKEGHQIENFEQFKEDILDLATPILDEDFDWF